MRKYEIMIIVNPDVDERQVTPLLEKHLALIAKNGGTVDSLETWGKRRLAYDILKKSEGIYVVANVTTTPADVAEVNRHMTIDEQILRTKVLRPDLH